MAIIAKQTGGGADFEVCPPNLYNAKCVDVIDLGMETSTWSGKEKTQQKIRIHWMLDHKQTNGFNFVVVQKYTLSLAEKATLYKDLVAWRGKEFTPQELAGFDLEKLIGAPCRILVNNYVSKKSGKEAHGVQSILKADPKKPVDIDTSKYVRKMNRPATAPQPGQNESLPDYEPAGLFSDADEDAPMPF